MLTTQNPSWRVLGVALVACLAWIPTTTVTAWSYHPFFSGKPDHISCCASVQRQRKTSSTRQQLKDAYRTQQIEKNSRLVVPQPDDRSRRRALQRSLRTTTAAIFATSTTSTIVGRSTIALAGETSDSAIDDGSTSSGGAATTTPSSPVPNPKPYASLEALIPAARVKRRIDQSVLLAEQLTKSTEKKQRQELLQKLHLTLLPSSDAAPVVVAIPERPAQQYLDAYDRSRRALSWLEQPGAVLAQRGEIAAWKRLKRQERASEGRDDIRAAFNLYTTSLTFAADRYTLTVPKQVRSQMVRNDALPDIKTVIQSDMGLRYLYRNQVLDAMEDARAEFELVSLSSSSYMDADELYAVLQKAQDACNAWFGLIDESDVKEAMGAING